MNFLNSKRVRYTLLFFTMLSISWCVYRDIQLTRQFPGDLRNRVVGSRLQMDGKSPYFYHWKEGEGSRYYDWSNATTEYQISNVTASPFFHDLLRPIVNQDHYDVAFTWLAIQYLSLLIIVLIGLSFTTNRMQKIAVIVTATVFPYTYAWTFHVFNGQMYIVIALFAALFTFCLTRKPSIGIAIAGGIFAAATVLTKPSACVFFIPFLVFATRFSRRYHIAFTFGALCLLGIAISSGNSRHYWSDYRQAVDLHIKGHQRLLPEAKYVWHPPILKKWEGWDVDKIHEAEKFRWYKPNGQTSSVFVFLNKTFNIRTPIWVLGLMAVAGIVILLALSYFQLRNYGAFTISQAAIAGFLCYMFTDLLSPVHRFHYNGAQWIFPLVVAATVYSPRQDKRIIIATFVGLVLNSLPFSMFRMQQSIGEYIVCFSLIAFLLSPKTWRSV